MLFIVCQIYQRKKKDTFVASVSANISETLPYCLSLKNQESDGSPSTINMNLEANEECNIPNFLTYKFTAINYFLTAIYRVVSHQPLVGFPGTHPMLMKLITAINLSLIHQRMLHFQLIAFLRCFLSVIMLMMIRTIKNIIQLLIQRGKNIFIALMDLDLY